MNPRIRLLSEIGNLSVYEVAGDIIRADKRGRDFTNFGHHYTYTFIPASELWIDHEAHPDEAPFFIRHMLVERRLMGSGAPRDEAMDLADRAERDERVRAMGRRRGEAPVEHPKIRMIGRLRSGVEVWLVDGKAIRDTLYTDFTEGGNWLVYGWIPEGEIWIDNDVVPSERVFVLLHELAESLLMGRGMGYDKAHSIATRVEWAKRMPQLSSRAEDKGTSMFIHCWISDNVSKPENHCFFYAAALAALFPGLTLVKGRHSWQHPEDTAHFWTEDEDGNIIDPTAGQYHSSKYSEGSPVSLEANLEDVVKDPLFKTLPYQDQEKILAASAMPLSKRFIGFRHFTALLPLSKRASARMRALSVKQPWANMIANGSKTIETRTWSTKYRGPLLIVSSARPAIKPAGQAVAIVDLVDCRHMTKEDERAARCEVYPSAQAWILDNIRKIKPFPVRGALGLFEVEMPIEYSAAV